jgi:23S rRNA (adenine2503-C2)-methyltransferase
MKPALTELLPQEIAETLGIAPFQGRQIFQWLHQKKIFHFEAMTNLSKALRQRLTEEYVPGQLTMVDLRQSPTTGTKKMLFRLADGETVESVLIRDGERRTLCISSQVGCALKCAFCATGKAGFTRNLSAGEIAEQALHLLQDEDTSERTPNLVFMGMGEPFLNYDPLVRGIRLLMHEEGVGVGARKITVSTVGYVPGVKRFTEEDWQVRLSVSLHAANDELRNRLVPVSRGHNLEKLYAALADYQRATGRLITFEWTLLHEVNDRSQDADELLRYIQGLKVAINVIPWNPVPGMDFQPSSIQRRKAFINRLEHGGVTATLRQEKGQDIEAACGQLRRIHNETNHKDESC